MITTLVEKFNKNHFLKSVVWIAGGTAVAQAISILSQPVISRLYSPVDFGVLTVLTAALGVLQPFGTLTYSITIPLAESDKLTVNLLRLCFLITSMFGVFMSGIVLFLEHPLSRYLQVPDSRYIWFIPICFVGTALYETLSAWAQRKKYFTIIARTRMSQGVIGACIKVGMGAMGFRPLGLLLGYFASNAAGCVSISLRLKKEDANLTNDFSWAEIYLAAKRFSRFPLIRLWTRLLLAFTPRIPVFFVAARFGAEIVGLFGMAASMISLPLTLISTSVAQVFYSEIASIGKSQPKKIQRTAMSVMKKMFYIGIAPTVAIFTLGPWMFAFFLGEQWREAGVYARILAIPNLFRFIGAPIASCLDVLEMQGTQLLFNLGGILLFASSFTVCSHYGLSSFDTIAVYALALSFHALLCILIVFFKLKKL